MAQNLKIANALYEGVPSISIPTQDGGEALFADTSDADAVAEDILEGKTAYVDGVKITGTGTGGGGTKYGISIDDLLGEVNASGNLQLPTGGNVDLVVSGFTSINSYVFQYKFSRNNALKTVVFTDLQEANGASSFERAFNSCTQLRSVSFPKLVSANGSSAVSYAFNGCTKLVSAEFPLLDIITGTSAFQYAFGGCTVLESVSFPSLRVIGNANAGTSTTNQQFYYTFQNCSKLTTLTFPALESIYCNGAANNQGTFAYNNKVTKLYFPKLTYIGKTSGYSNNTAANNIFYSCSALKEIHFAAENQSAIESLTGYSTKWGRSAATIYFDL